MKVAAILTCHNRRESTLACLEALYSLDKPSDWELTVYLTDDGSSDGTYEIVQEFYPEVFITRTDGNAYWNGGMYISFEKALQGGHDRFLWLNDDTHLVKDTLLRLEHTLNTRSAISGEYAIVVGTVQDRKREKVTYGGVVFSSWWKRTTPQLVYSETEAVACETVNGNCVWIPVAVASVVGNLDTIFVHGLGDFDYGLRARKAGIALWVAPGFVGVCDRNRIEGTFMDRNLPLRKRLKIILGPKGRPPHAWAVFTRRHCGPAWVFYWFFPYVRVFATWSIAWLSRTLFRRRTI
ncbi:GT2 family glycosyltransferase [Nitrosospira sp. Nsp5]|uniref:Glycosyltransferase, GT2 family n=1 Tax=Nitrosospira multiformis TaxID=1231 RepID=A0ABY0TB90_9PROT|nr:MULTISPECIES: glycosyltransferase family 2 protein [Nitrosospira]PTR09399.1 GT2 family glycosyltransferase [Nitrosospira sp. Nsp5]SCY23882.1 Glycosyltransferase, GT2 family [Nitrosospira sp. Nsp13]SDQ30753.1 Glycosyltransferase, GT2 family [Nitrosospira multiformis]